MERIQAGASPRPDLLRVLDLDSSLLGSLGDLTGDCLGLALRL